jgi:hypothetical protein
MAVVLPSIRTRQRGAKAAGSRLIEGMAHMRYMLRVDNLEFEVAQPPAPKLEQNGSQKRDRNTNAPVWSVGLTALNPVSETAEGLMVSVASEVRPDLRWRQPVVVEDLEMLPWSQKRNNGDVQSGVAFRATAIRAVDALVSA